MEAYETIEYKDCSIEIYPDEGYESPDEWGNDNLFLVFYHRDFTIERDKVVTKDELIDYFYEGSKIDQCREYWIFPVTAYIHSGVHLYLGRLNETACDPGGWDTSFAGALLVSKKEWRLSKSARNVASGLIETWNDYLSGNVWGFNAIGPDGEEIDSCWGFYGDYELDMIPEAQSSIDYFLKEEREKKNKKTKQYIKNSVPLLYRSA